MAEMANETLSSGGKGVSLSDVLDVESLAQMVAEGYVRACDGPEGMTLYNYTPRAQYGRVWNAETLACRGLIVRADGTIQSRPFGKFFNLSEHDNPDLPTLPVEPFEVFEKLDGSLIVVTTTPSGNRLVTTRGSFQSEQAVAAHLLWEERWPDVYPPEGETWLFEFIAPWNRIVVDYGERTDLVMLARIDNITGRDISIPMAWPGEVVRRYDGMDDFETIAAQLAELGPNDEGFVLRFQSGMRAKAKGSEYMRLHKLITGVSARTIWENLSNGTPLTEVLDRVPDEFAQWVLDTSGTLLRSFYEVEDACRVKHAAVCDLPTRKDQALAIADFEHKAVVFKMLDGYPHDAHIWKCLRPAAERPFRTEDE
jgi:RNA ligase